MPLRSVDRLDELLPGGLRGKRVLLLGLAYRPDVGDTRHSASQTFYEEARRRGADVLVHDPLVARWEELGLEVPAALPPAADLDALVFAVSHGAYASVDFVGWLSGHRLCVLDANGVLSPARRRALREAGCTVGSIGRGDDT